VHLPQIHHVFASTTLPKARLQGVTLVSAPALHVIRLCITGLHRSTLPALELLSQTSTGVRLLLLLLVLPAVLLLPALLKFELLRGMGLAATLIHPIILLRAEM
jgi:hypothetical protein